MQLINFLRSRIAVGSVVAREIYLVYFIVPTVFIASLLRDAPSEIVERRHWISILSNKSCGNVGIGDDSSTRSVPVGNWCRQQTCHARVRDE